MFCASATLCAAACAIKHSRRSARKSSFLFMIVYKLEVIFCWSLSNSNRLDANTLGFVRALCIATIHNVKPTTRNSPVSDTSTKRRCVSQNATTSRITANTVPTPRQNSADSIVVSSDNRCSLSSSNSVDSNSSRVCTIATNVANRFVKESNSPLLDVFSVMVCLAICDQ